MTVVWRGRSLGSFRNFGDDPLAYARGFRIGPMGKSPGMSALLMKVSFRNFCGRYASGPIVVAGGRTAGICGVYLMGNAGDEAFEKT